jgi:HlyD family secretion protein
MTASADIAPASVKNALLALRFTPPETATKSTGVMGKLFKRPGGSTTTQPDASSTGNAKQVWVLRGGAPVAVPVTVGKTNGRYTEIIGGNLAEGTQVITDLAGAQS